jgi:Fe-S-cluster containining protein
MPGALIPGDLERIVEYVQPPNPTDFIATHFLASEGAKVGKFVEREGRPTLLKFHVPSLVPAQKPDGRCVFLDEADRCRIHPVAPYGCAYHDVHMLLPEAEERFRFCIEEQMQAHQEGGLYHGMCILLTDLELRAAPLKERQARFAEEVALQ